MATIHMTAKPQRQLDASDVAQPVLAPARDAWVPACGGTEVPFTSRNGVRMLYCWQASTGRHAYINLDTDMEMTDQEAFAALGM